MPDADKVHWKLPGPYQDPYKQLCEGQNPTDVARGFAGGLKKSLKYHGNEPAEVIKKVSGLVRERQSGPLFYDASTHREILDTFEEIVCEEIDNRRTAGITERALKQAYSEHMLHPESEEFEDLACEHYVRGVFEESCSSRLQHTPVHDLGVEHEEIEARMQDVIGVLEDDFGAFATQIKASGNVKKIRLPGQKKSPPPDLGDNLLKM